MKPITVCAGILALSACAQQTPDVISLDDIRDARGDMPGFDTVINCNRGPRIIYDKFGEIMETVQPIKHPSCKDRDEKIVGLSREGDMLVVAGGPSPFNEASDDDPTIIEPIVVSATGDVPDDGNPATEPAAAVPCTSLECEPTDVQEWVKWREHFGWKTTQQDIIDHVEKYGGTW